MALLENKHIVLGSASPRRRELLSMILTNFEVIAPVCDETLDPNLEITKAIEDISLRKALSINSGDIIITADTLVVLNDKILGKPNNRQDAFNMLSMLSGNTHKVITAVTIKTTEKTVTFSNETKITFSTLETCDIEDYLNTDEPYDKAGSYGIQGLAGVFVSKIEGDYFNVVGLPINKLKQHLKNL